jgi:hypothetical protein
MSVGIHIGETSFGSEIVVSASTKQRVVSVGGGENLQSVLFHLLNHEDFVVPLPDGQRFYRHVTMEVSGWIVSLHPVPSLHGLVKGLRESGGYAVTHHGWLRRCSVAFAARGLECIRESPVDFLHSGA